MGKAKRPKSESATAVRVRNTPGVYRRGETFYIRFKADGRERWEAAGPTKALAVALLNRRKLERAEGRVLPGKRRRVRLTVEQAGKAWLEHAKATKRSWKRDRQCLRHLNAIVGATCLDALSPIAIEAYKRKRLAQTYRKTGETRDRPTTASTVNRELTLLRTILRRAVRDGTLTRNPFDGVKLLREPPGRATRLLPEDEARLLRACRDFRLRAAVRLALHTGLRQGELLALRWGDVDLRARIVRVERATPGGDDGTKGGGRRDVPLNADAVEVLAGLRPKDPPPEALVFHTAKGLPYTDLPRDWRKARARARLAGFRFHDTRHAFATRLVEGGTPLLTVAKLLGHGPAERPSLAMVARYASVSPEYERAAVERLVGGGARGPQAVPQPAPNQGSRRSKKRSSGGSHGANVVDIAQESAQ